MLKHLDIKFAFLTMCYLAIGAHETVFHENTSFTHLNHPSPINPDIISDPKSEDKIIPIPHEPGKIHKRESQLSSTSTLPILPEPVNLQNNEQKYPTDGESHKSNHSQIRRQSLNDKSSNLSDGSTISLKNSEDDSREHSHHNQENVKKPTTDKYRSQKDSSTDGSHEINRNRQPYVPPSYLSKAQKRDVPVSVSESEKENTSTIRPKTVDKKIDEMHKRETTEKNAIQTSTTAHPAVLSQPIPIADLLRNKPTK